MTNLIFISFGIQIGHGISLVIGIGNRHFGEYDLLLVRLTDLRRLMVPYIK
jgi:hypothetical protein